MKKLNLLFICLLLVGCSNNVEVIQNESLKDEVPKIISSTMEELNAGNEINILKETLPNNDSGVENPQHQFYEVFGERDEYVGPPEGYITMDMNKLYLDGYIGMFGEEDGTFIYESLKEYDDSELLTDELYLKIIDVGDIYGIELEKYKDFDKDGLSDYEEIEVYGSDPNRKSTSGDFYSDGYKVDNDMDLFTVYEVEWRELDDFTLILPNDFSSMQVRGCNSYTNYLDNPLIEYLSLPYNFHGEMKRKPAVDCDINELRMSIYNPSTLEYSEIDFNVDNNYLHFIVEPGYTKFLIYHKSVDVDELLEPYRN